MDKNINQNLKDDCFWASCISGTLKCTQIWHKMHNGILWNFCFYVGNNGGGGGISFQKVNESVAHSMWIKESCWFWCHIVALRGNVGENQTDPPTCRLNLYSYSGYQKYSWIQGPWAIWFQLSKYHRGQGPPSWFSGIWAQNHCWRPYGYRSETGPANIERKIQSKNALVT